MLSRTFAVVWTSGLGITKWQFLIQKIKKIVSCIFFLIFDHQNLESGFVSGFTWNAGSGSGLNESGSTTLPFSVWLSKSDNIIISVADPDPAPPDPLVFGPPGSGSGSTSQRYASGSGSFYHHAKIVRKTLIPTILWLFLTFYLWKMM